MQEPIPLTPLSKAISTAAVQAVHCPKCNQNCGYYCRMPSGRQAETTHPERIQLYRASIGESEFRNRHTIQCRRLPFL